jgi:hypothetical protein
MSPFFDDLEAQLRSAARGVAAGQHVPRARRRRRWFSPARLDLAPVLATVVVVVLVAGAALVLLGHGRQQPPSPPASPPPKGGLAALINNTPQKQLRREFAYMAAATKHVLASPVCQHELTTPSFVHGTPDRSLLSILGVLRRPATPADRPNPSVFDGMTDVYSGSARRAFSAGGESYYVAVAGFDEAASVPSNQCLALQARALAQYLPNIPSGLRKPTQELQAGFIAYAQNVRTHGPRDGVCLIDVGLIVNGASCGITATQIKGNATREDDNGVFIGVVPDGVASVTLAIPAAHGHPARSLTGPVRGNVYAIRVGGPDEQPIQPAITWRSAEGRVLKSIPVPTPAMERAACRQQIVMCTLLRYGPMTSTTSSSGPSVRRASPAPTAH